ncbi:response regulator [Plantactinospora sp. CA-290183]|uniref:response regulator n=1 Tax=Plantactinospora sp. CA-290183 TaxID=3240006 RepID=UPI003D8C524E
MPAPATVRIALVDDHPLFVRGLELLLPSITGGRAEGSGSTGDASAAAALVRRCLPDLALVDLHMPPPGGIRAISAVRRTTPGVRVVAMSGLAEPELAVQALRAGAEGYLPKSSEPEELLPPLLAVLDGWAVLPAELLGALVAPARTPLPAAALLDDEERQLLRLIAKGRSTLEIADELHVSERTVKRLTASLLRKLRVSTRTEAAALAGNAGLL